MFRKKPFVTPLASPCSVKVIKENIQSYFDDSGSEVCETTYDEVDACDPENFVVLPDRKEYTLSHLLKSGVPLERIPVGTLLQSNNADLDVIDNLLNKLKEEKSSLDNPSNPE